MTWTRRAAIAVALTGLLAGCAEASPTQNVNIGPGKRKTGYTAEQLTAARAWLAQPHAALPKGWRYAVLLVVDPKFDAYVEARPDCDRWFALAAYTDGTLGRLCESFRSGEQAVMLLGPGDAVAYDDTDNDQTFTLPKELRLVAKNVLAGGE